LQCAANTNYTALNLLSMSNDYAYEQQTKIFQNQLNEFDVYSAYAKTKKIGETLRQLSNFTVLNKNFHHTKCL